MFQKNIFIFLFFCVNFFVFSQNQKLLSEKDSILYYLKKSKQNKPLFYLKKAVRLSEKAQIDSLIRKTNIKYGYQSYLVDDTLSLAIAGNNLWNLYIRTKDSIALARYYRYKGLICEIKNDVVGFYSYYSQSKDISIKIKDSLAAGSRLLRMAITQRYENDYLGSERTTIEALRYIEPLNKQEKLSELYKSLGLILNSTGRNEDARKYYKLYNDINQKSIVRKKREESQVLFLNNTGWTYINEENYTKAVPLFKKGLLLDSIEIKFPSTYQLLLSNLSYCYFKLEKKELALEGYHKVLKSTKKKNSTAAECYIHTLLADFYLLEEQPKKALFHSKKALKLARKIKNNKTILDVLYILSDLTKGEESKNYLQKHIKLKDSLFTRERNMKNQFAKVRYETEKKDKENHQLKEENTQKQAQLTKERQQKLIAILLASMSLLTIGFGAYLVRNRRKQLLFQAQLKSVAAREKERQQIAKTLHDEVAGDLRMLHQRLAKNTQNEEAQKLEVIKENVRNLSHRLSSVHFKEVSFKNQMINLAGDCFENNFSVFIQNLDAIHWKAIDESIKRVLYLSCRESVQNTQKYAGTSKIHLVFSQVKKEILLTIKDEGKGFDIAKAPNGIGLKNMRERVEDLQGTFAIESEENRGTTINIRIPINGKAAY